MKVLIVEARYHESVADALTEGATAALEKGGVPFERLSVPGSLEIASAIALAAPRHFAMIAAESAHGLMRLGIEHHLCIGNGIPAAENEDEALRRAEFSRGEAARACLALMQWRARPGLAI
jgi:6,7-dimethyl-8-ribityllumazine synthase